MTDQHRLALISREADNLIMHFGHQGAGGIEDSKAFFLGVRANLFRHTMGTENHQGTPQALPSTSSTNIAPLGMQICDNCAVMHHLVAHIYGSAIQLQCPVNDFDCPVNASTKASGAR